MIIEKIKLVNWGPHKHLEENINCNIVGIIGPNGRGKTNFLSAINYAFNGSQAMSGSTVGNQETFIYRYGKPDGAKKAEIELTFRKNGKVGVINRTITKSKTTRTLTWDGNEYTSAKEVDSLISDILGADKAAITTAIFIRQGEVATLIQGKPEERRTHLRKLMHLSYIESRVNDIQAKITKLQAGLVDLQPALDIQNNNKAQNEELLSTLKEQLSTKRLHTQEKDLLFTLAGLLDKLAALQSNYSTQTAFINTLTTNKASLLEEHKIASANDLIPVLKALDTEIDSYYEILSKGTEQASIQGRLAEQKTVLESLILRRDALSIIINESKTVEEYNAAIKEYEEKLSCLNHLKTCEDVLAIKQTELEHHQYELNLLTPLAVLDVQYNSNKESLVQTIQLRQERVQLQQLKYQIATAVQSHCTSLDTCPVCSTQLNHSMSFDVDAIRKELADAQQELNEATRQEQNLSNEYNSNKNNLMEKTWSVESANAAVSDAITTLINAKQTCAQHNIAIDITKEDSALMVQYLQTSLSEHKGELQRLIATNSEYTSVIASCTVCENNIAQLTAQIDPNALSYSPEDLETYKQLIENKKTERNKYQSIQNELNTLQSKIDTASDQLNKQQETYKTESELFNRYNEDPIIVSLRDEDGNINYSAKYKELNDLDIEYSNLETNIRHVEHDIDAIDRTIADLNNRMEADRAQRDLINMLGRSKALIAKDGVPLNYMIFIFEKLTVLVQDYLNKMDANFNVVIDEERPLTYRFIRNDDDSEFSMPQEKLSGGQAIRLSLALLISCQQLLFPEVGFLVLDEPSSHIDKEGVESLAELFKSMSQIFSNSETQLIVVDHNDILTTAFEHTIVL